MNDSVRTQILVFTTTVTHTCTHHVSGSEPLPADGSFGSGSAALQAALIFVLTGGGGGGSGFLVLKSVFAIHSFKGGQVHCLGRILLNIGSIYSFALFLLILLLICAFSFFVLNQFF